MVGREVALAIGADWFLLARKSARPITRVCCRGRARHKVLFHPTATGNIQVPYPGTGTSGPAGG